MASKESTLESAYYWIRKTGEPEVIYRVGPAWMMGGKQSHQQIQAKYKVPVRDYTIIWPDDPEIEGKTSI